MPEAVTRYQCEYCGSDYHDLLDAEQCEETHILLADLDAIQPVYDAHHPFPETFTLRDPLTSNYQRYQKIGWS